MRDLLADSRFDNMRLRLRSSTTESTGGFVASSEPEPEFVFLVFWSGSSEPDTGESRGGGLELAEQELEITGCWGSSGEKIWGSSCVGKGKGGSWHSQGEKPPSKAVREFPKKLSAGIMAGKADNMAGDSRI